MSIWNERVKLLAGWLNGISVAMIALGMLAPIAKILFQDEQATNMVILSWWGLGALIVHSAAHWILTDLEE